jgi:hypothetical protein
VGRAGPLVAVIAVLWSSFVLVVSGLNFLASEILGVTLAMLFAVYVFGIKRSFEGPRVKLADLEEQPIDDDKKAKAAE